MGLISKMLSEKPKLDVPFTIVRIVSLSEDRETTFRIIDDIYSKRGRIVKTIELYSFEGEFGEAYTECVKWCLKAIDKVQAVYRANLLQ